MPHHGRAAAPREARQPGGGGGRGAAGAAGGRGRRGGGAAALRGGGRVPGGSGHGGAGPAALRPSDPGAHGPGAVGARTDPGVSMGAAARGLGMASPGVNEGLGSGPAWGRARLWPLARNLKGRQKPPLVNTHDFSSVFLKRKVGLQKPTANKIISFSNKRSLLPVFPFSSVFSEFWHCHVLSPCYFAHRGIFKLTSVVLTVVLTCLSFTVFWCPSLA